MIATRLLIVLYVLSACSFAADATSADVAVALFHERFDQGEFRQIYSDASDEFRRSTTEATWLAVAAAVRSKLGKIQSSRQLSFTIRTTPDVTAVNLVYETTFEEGAATEHFTWAIRGGRAVLIGYRVESPLLITR